VTTDTQAIELLTASRMRTFRDCARRHQLAYVEGWRPVRDAEALRFGTLVHRGLEAYWRAIQVWQQDSSILAPDALSAALAAIAVETDPFDRVKAEEILRVYAERWIADEQEYEVLDVEAQFECSLLNPETMHPSKTWRLAGKIDVIVRRRLDERVLVIEHKTAGEDVSSDDATYWTKLAIDPQCSAYVIGAESLGYQVDEILYDVLGKPSQRPLKATPIEARKFTKDGKLYAAQRLHDETPEEYCARVREAMEANPGRFATRKAIPRAESQIADFLADAWQQAGVMRDCARLGRAARNVEACHRFGVCPYWNLCSTGGRPEDYPSDYVRAVTKHPELV
jgi:hypothetical protein